MFKSIFTKFITAFTLIILISFLMLALIISSMMVNYYTDTSADQLRNAADSARAMLERRLSDSEADTLNSYVTAHSGEVEAFFSAFSRYTNEIAFFVTDAEGNILASVGLPDSAFQSDRVPKSSLSAEEGDSFYGSSDLGGALSTRRNVCGTALSVGGKVLGTVYACTASQSADVLMRTTVKAIIMTCLWVLLAALIAVYFLSDRIISPLKDMSKASKSFAAGKFDVRVPVRGRDEIAELALAFNNMASSLNDLETMRSSFLSNVSHDLRTPMTTISGFIDGLLDGTIPEDRRDHYLRMIGEEVRRLSRLVAALLDVSRLEAGERKFTMGAFDVCEMARVILISFEQKIEEKQLAVEFENDSENMYVWADRDAIYQILYNICDNAVKFSRDGGKYRVKISERDRKVFVSVYNEGIGIPPEDLPHVFERFYKSDKSRGLDKSGVGLGLYIAKSIIDAHDEEIWVKSNYGEFCEFIFTLKKATDGQIKKTFVKQPTAGGHPEEEHAPTANAS